MTIRIGGLDDPQIIALLEIHADGMRASSPPGTCRFLDLSGLLIPEISFMSRWDADKLLGFGALKDLGDGTGEIKSMRTAPDALGQGVGASILHHIIKVARERGYTAVLLETGTSAPFDAARHLYAKHGFVPCDCFSDYVKLPSNCFMRLDLTS